MRKGKTRTGRIESKNSANESKEQSVRKGKTRTGRIESKNSAKDRIRKKQNAAKNQAPGEA